MSYKLVLGVALVVLVVVGGWWAFKMGSDDTLANISASVKLTDAQVQAVVERVGKFMVIPTDEKPSVAVLKDTDALAQQQSFYRGAKDGDILVIYSSRAIIYDPVANKLVSVSPIQAAASASPSPIASGSATITPSASPAAPEKVTVDVRNGTATAGLASSTANTLKKNSWVTIGAVGDAKGSFAKTVLVDLTNGKKPNAVAALAEVLKVTAVTAIPTGESTSTADILVIVGK
jgi:hypothetical protein